MYMLLHHCGCPALEHIRTHVLHLVAGDSLNDADCRDTLDPQYQVLLSQRLGASFCRSIVLSVIVGTSTLGLGHVFHDVAHMSNAEY